MVKSNYIYNQVTDKYIAKAYVFFVILSATIICYAYTNSGGSSLAFAGTSSAIQFSISEAVASFGLKWKILIYTLISIITISVLLFHKNLLPF